MNEKQIKFFAAAYPASESLLCLKLLKALVNLFQRFK